MTIGRTVRYAGAVAAAMGLAAVGLAAIAQAQTPAPFRIGLMEGFSGVYGDLTQGEVEAVQMGIDEGGGQGLRPPIELLLAGQQNKPPVGAALPRQMVDGGGGEKITRPRPSSVAPAGWQQT